MEGKIFYNYDELSVESCFVLKKSTALEVGFA